jgi:DNA repair protein RecN (Recombination protein N)
MPSWTPALLARYAEAYAHHQALLAEKEALEAALRERRAREDLLRFQLAEIQGAKVQPARTRPFWRRPEASPPGGPQRAGG